MIRTNVTVRGVLAVALLALAVPAARAAVSGTPDPAAKGWFNRLRGGGSDAGGATSKAEKEAAEQTQKLEAQAVAGASLGLEKTVARLRVTNLGKDPQAVPYLDLIERGTATAPQLNDFAAYVAYRGLVGQAVEFQRAAVKLDGTQATYWLNLGTMQRALRQFGSAESAFQRAIQIDPANALAYYNLGTVLDAQEKYDDGLEAFRRALILDPKLADPRVNPQVVGNDRMLVVKLLIAQTQSGAMSLPLITVQDKGGAKK
jgi:tetratricopeptide (TPR) repeat protein